MEERYKRYVHRQPNPYRRRLPKDTAEIQAKQRFLFQCAISVILAVTVVVLVLLPKNITGSVRLKLKEAVSRHISVEDMKQSAFYTELRKKIEETAKKAGTAEKKEPSVQEELLPELAPPVSEEEPAELKNQPPPEKSLPVKSSLP